MKILIMGCGRTGSQLAAMLDAEGDMKLPFWTPTTKAFTVCLPTF